MVVIVVGFDFLQDYFLELIDFLQEDFLELIDFFFDLPFIELKVINDQVILNVNLLMDH